MCSDVVCVLCVVCWVCTKRFASKLQRQGDRVNFSLIYFLYFLRYFFYFQGVDVQ